MHFLETKFFIYRFDIEMMKCHKNYELLEQCHAKESVFTSQSKNINNNTEV